MTSNPRRPNPINTAAYAPTKPTRRPARRPPDRMSKSADPRDAKHGPRPTVVWLMIGYRPPVVKRHPAGFRVRTLARSHALGRTDILVCHPLGRTDILVCQWPAGPSPRRSRPTVERQAGMPVLPIRVNVFTLPPVSPPPAPSPPCLPARPQPAPCREMKRGASGCVATLEFRTMPPTWPRNPSALSSCVGPGLPGQGFTDACIVRAGPDLRGRPFGAVGWAGVGLASPTAPVGR